MDKIKAALEAALKEARSALEGGDKDAIEKSRAKVADLSTQLNEERAKLDAELEYRKVEDAMKNIPKPPAPEARALREGFAEIRAAMAEKRAITVNGTGAVGVVAEIVKELVGKMALLKKLRYFYGPNGSTVIPILSPGLAVPAGKNEGATAVADDGTAVLGSVSLLPKAYVAILGVSAEALLMSGANILAALPGIFGDAFMKAMHTGALTGDGTGNNMKGMFLDAAITNNVPCAVAGTPKLLDLAKLALTVQDSTDDALILLHPTLVAAMLAETTAESAPIKQELMTSRSCMGVPLLITGSAPSAITAGSIVAVAMDMANYGVAVANELAIDPIKVKGDTNTYFQATMFFNGSPIVPKNGWQLVTI